MKRSNPFKSFQVFSTNGGRYTLQKYTTPKGLERAAERLADRLSEDPTGAQWGTIGLVEPDGVSLLLPTSKGVMLAVQFNDRILPGKVRDEHLRKRVAALMEQEGRAVSKREYAQLRDDVEAELLPKSHIRRSIVPVLFMDAHMVIFTSSAKKADDIAAFMLNTTADLKHTLKLSRLTTNDSVAPWLTAVATSDDESPLEASTVAVLRSVDEELKATLRIKDKDINSQEVQTLLESGDYHVTELGVDVMSGAQTAGIEGLRFTLTSKLVFKGLKFPDLAIQTALGEVDGDEATVGEFHAIAELTASTVAELIKIINEALGGEQTLTEDEDEEL